MRSTDTARKLYKRFQEKFDSSTETNIKTSYGRFLVRAISHPALEWNGFIALSEGENIFLVGAGVFDGLRNFLIKVDCGGVQVSGTRYVPEKGFKMRDSVRIEFGLDHLDLADPFSYMALREIYSGGGRLKFTSETFFEYERFPALRRQRS